MTKPSPIKYLISIILSCLICMLNFPGCIGAGAPAARTVGIAMPTKNLERFVRDGEFLKTQFEAAGYNVEIRYSNDDSGQQNNDVEYMIADRVDLLIICAVDGVTLSQTLKTAEEYGIPVVAYDRLIMNSSAVDCYISFDNYTVGKLQGEFMAKALGLDERNDPARLEFIAGDPADNNAPYFFRGAYDALEPYLDSGKCKVLSGKTAFTQCATQDWSTDKAYENMQNLLASYYVGGGSLDGVLCSNDSVALGVSRAIDSDYNGKAPVITGQDGDIINLRNIVDGRQTMTVFKNVNDEAEAALEVSKAILQGETIGSNLLSVIDASAAFDDTSYYNGKKYVSSFLLDPTVITKDNLDELVDTGMYRWDNDHRYLVAQDR